MSVELSVRDRMLVLSVYRYYREGGLPASAAVAKMEAAAFEDVTLCARAGGGGRVGLGGLPEARRRHEYAQQLHRAFLERRRRRAAAALAAYGKSSER